MEDAIGDRLWIETVSARTYDHGGERYQLAIMDQYKIYVEMADRISSRRALANTFFLGVNTAVVSAGTFALQSPAAQGSHAWLLTLPVLALVGQCMAWFYIVRSYRQLNGVKYMVIGEMEKRLPASPYWAAEWAALGRGTDRRRYWPLTHLEQWVPVFFGAIYILALTAALLM